MSLELPPPLRVARSVRRALGAIVRDPDARWLAASLAVGLGSMVLLLGYEPDSAALVYSVDVDELLSSPERYRGRDVRAQGLLVEGSLAFDEERGEHRFVLERGGHELRIRFPRMVVPDTLVAPTGLPPDEPLEVIVGGRLGDKQVFVADEVIPRCPSHYRGRPNLVERHPEYAHGLTR